MPASHEASTYVEIFLSKWRYKIWDAMKRSNVEEQIHRDIVSDVPSDNRQPKHCTSDNCQLADLVEEWRARTADEGVDCRVVGECTILPSTINTRATHSTDKQTPARRLLSHSSHLC